MRFRSAVALFLPLLVLAGCAGLLDPQLQNVTINSNPQGAVVKIDERSFATPATIPLKGNSEYYFTVEKAGYKPVAGKVDRHFRVWYSVDNTVTLEALPVPPVAAVQPAPPYSAPAAVTPAPLLPVPQPLLQPLPGTPAMAHPVPAPEAMVPVQR